jgi:hypothetical protein
MLMLNQVNEAVGLLNELVCEQCGEVPVDCGLQFGGFFSFNSDGVTIAVEFLNFHIWSSDDDGREWQDGEEVGQEWQEPLIDYLRREANKVLAIVGKIKL